MYVLFSFTRRLSDSIIILKVVFLSVIFHIYLKYRLIDISSMYMEVNIFK